MGKFRNYRKVFSPRELKKSPILLVHNTNWLFYVHDKFMDLSYTKYRDWMRTIWIFIVLYLRTTIALWLEFNYTSNSCDGFESLSNKSCYSRVSTVTTRNVVHSSTVPNFIKLLSTTIRLAWKFFHDINRITNQISICWMLLRTGVQPESHV